MEWTRICEGKSIILGVEHNKTTAGAELGLIACLNSIGLRLHLKTAGFKEFHLSIMGNDFLVAQLGVLPYLGRVQPS
jgi:hypothetical protein